MENSLPVYYDETSPSCLRWKYDKYVGKARNVLKVRAGDVVGFKCPVLGYWRFKYLGNQLLAHRVIMQLAGHDTTNQQIDHISGDRSDNRLCNLRVVKRKVNSQNCVMTSRNSSGITGVKWKDAACVAFSQRTEKTQIERSFSTRKYGLLPAMKMAIEARRLMISTLIQKGESYTERHGK